MFAILMGTSRAFYAKFSEKINLIAFMTASSLLCVASYLLASLSPIPLLSLAGCRALRPFGRHHVAGHL